ncbi:CRAL/TRIO, N-terminal domain, partial [Fusarium oxysporum f. sp. vasinfectum]
MLSPLRTLILPLALARLSIAWDTTYYVVVRSITTEIVPDYNQTETVELTAPLTVSPVTERTISRTDYFVATENGDGRAVVDVTTIEVRLPTSAALPTSTSGSSAPRTEPSIETHYYAKAVVSNPSSCTKTKFTYTDSIGVSLPDSLTDQATDSSLVELVTTYVSTISTNLGGQAVTTSRCDVYFNADAVPVGYPDIGIDGESLLSECVDPRRSHCTEDGENDAATGAGGCKGPYPPTEALDGGPSSTGEDSPVTYLDGFANSGRQAGKLYSGTGGEASQAMAIYPSALWCYREQPGLPTDASATQEQTAASEAGTSKMKRFGMFRKNRAGPKLGTASSDSLAKNGEEDDKYGQTKQFHEALANNNPETIRATMWAMVKNDHPDALVLRFLRARKQGNGEAGAVENEKDGDTHNQRLGIV